MWFCGMGCLVSEDFSVIAANDDVGCCFALSSCEGE